MHRALGVQIPRSSKPHLRPALTPLTIRELHVDLRVETNELRLYTFSRMWKDFICPEDVSGLRALIDGNVRIGVPRTLQININKVREVEIRAFILRQHTHFQQFHWLYDVAHAFDRVDIVVYDGRVTELPHHLRVQQNFNEGIQYLVRTAPPNVDTTLEVFHGEGPKIKWRLKLAKTHC